MMKKYLLHLRHALPSSFRNAPIFERDSNIFFKNQHLNPSAVCEQCLEEKKKKKNMYCQKYLLFAINLSN